MQAVGQEQITLSYGRLHEQFGSGIAVGNYRLFRNRFKQALADVAKYWTSQDGTKHLLNYELHEDGFTYSAAPCLSVYRAGKPCRAKPSRKRP